MTTADEREYRRTEALTVLTRDGQAHEVSDHADALILAFGQKCRDHATLNELVNALNHVRRYVAGLEAAALATIKVESTTSQPCYSWCRNATCKGFDCSDEYGRTASHPELRRTA